MTVCNKESYSMGAVNFSVESHTPVPICQFRERPKDTHVRTVVFDDISKPNALRFSLSSFKTPSQSSKLFWGGTMFGRLGLHRCSPEASVLGRGRFGERLGTFSINQLANKGTSQYETIRALSFPDIVGNHLLCADAD
jgi:hypothetical protein